MKRIRESEYFKLNIITTLLCLIPFVIGAVFYAKLPGELAIHFDVHNQPDGYASKAFALFAIPAFLLLTQFLVCGFCEMDPKKKNASRGMQILGRILIPVVSIGIQCVIILFGMNKQFDLSMVVYLLMGFLFLIIGNLLPKCKYNYTIGIRIPTTLANEENWNKTHRMAGFVWVIGSLVMIGCTVLRQYAYLWTVLVIMVVVPVVYSVVYAIKNKE